MVNELRLRVTSATAIVVAALALPAAWLGGPVGRDRRAGRRERSPSATSGGSRAPRRAPPIPPRRARRCRAGSSARAPLRRPLRRVRRALRRRLRASGRRRSSASACCRCRRPGPPLGPGEESDLVGVIEHPPIFHLPGIPDHVTYTWFVMIILAGLAFAASRRVALVPRGRAEPDGGRARAVPRHDRRRHGPRGAPVPAADRHAGALHPRQQPDRHRARHRRADREPEHHRGVRAGRLRGLSRDRHPQAGRSCTT